MIQADKQLIQSQLKQSSLQVREKELRFFTSNFESLGTTSALLAGFAFSALSNNVPDKTHFLVSFLFHVTTTASMMFSIWCVCNCTFISMFGPGLALRGPDGSMHKAVEGMMEERIDVYLYFRLGIVFIHIATAMLIWCYRHHNHLGWLDGLAVTIMLMYSLYKLNGFTVRIQNRFDHSEIENKKIAGILDGDLYKNSNDTPRKVQKKIYDPDRSASPSDPLNSKQQGRAFGDSKGGSYSHDATSRENERQMAEKIEFLQARLRQQQLVIAASDERSSSGSGSGARPMEGVYQGAGVAAGSGRGSEADPMLNALEGEEKMEPEQLADYTSSSHTMSAGSEPADRPSRKEQRKSSLMSWLGGGSGAQAPPGMAKGKNAEMVIDRARKASPASTV